MRHSARRSGPVRPVNRGNPMQGDPSDALALEFLRLWIGISRLRDQCGDGPRPVKSRRPIR